MPVLRFEDVPSTAVLGETHNVAILLETDDGEPMSDVDGVKVQISLEAPHSSFADALDAFVKAGGIQGIEDLIELSCGEGIVEITIKKAAPCNSVMLVAKVVSGLKDGDAVEPVEAEMGVPCLASTAAAAGSGTTDVADEELSDVTHIVERLRAAAEKSTSENVGSYVRHYEMLLKGRLWNASGNSKKLLDAGLAPLLLSIIETAPASGGASQDAVLEALNVFEELLSNVTACVQPSCSACRSLIKPNSKLEVLNGGPKYGIYHAACLKCRGCHESMHDNEFVRAEGSMAPYHAACAAKANVKTTGEPIRCQVMPSLTGRPEDNVAAKAFWTPGAPDNFEKLIKVLQEKWVHRDEFIKERAGHVARHILAADPENMAAQRLFGELSKK